MVYFFPFLSYGIHVWGVTNSTYFDLNFVLQKKVLKSITFNDITSPAMPIFHKLELLWLTFIIFNLYLLSMNVLMGYPYLIFVITLGHCQVRMP